MPWESVTYLCPERTGALLAVGWLSAIHVDLVNRLQRTCPVLRRVSNAQRQVLPLLQGNDVRAAIKCADVDISRQSIAARDLEDLPLIPAQVPTTDADGRCVCTHGGAI